jgi:hypothetical protein
MAQAIDSNSSPTSKGTAPKKDLQARKFTICVNTPTQKGLDHEKIKQLLGSFRNPPEYWCMSDEMGESGNFHSHIYIQLKSATRFSRIKKLFPEAHIESSRGSLQENRMYVLKEGKWSSDPKAHTRVAGSFEESGPPPAEPQSTNDKFGVLHGMIKDGFSDYEILEARPDFLRYLEKIDRVRQMLREEEYKTTFRTMEVIYLYGPTGVGKTRYVMEKYGYENVYKVVNYEHPFDLYKGQSTMLFDEFRSSVKLQDMLVYLDGYPLALPARYHDRQACYETVYIVSNIPLYDNYCNVQEEEPASWAAFLRRIHHVYRMDAEGNLIEVFPSFIDMDTDKPYEASARETLLPELDDIPF